MSNKFLKFVPYVGLVASLAGIIANAKKPKEMLICSPMMDDGFADPIMEYKKAHPGAVITDELGEKILNGTAK